MRNGDGVLHPEHVLGGEVGHIAGNLAAFQRGGQRFGVGELGAAEVEQVHAVFHLGDGAFAEHAAGSVGEGYVHGDVIRGAVDLIHGGGTLDGAAEPAAVHAA